MCPRMSHSNYHSGETITEKKKTSNPGLFPREIARGWHKKSAGSIARRTLNTTLSVVLMKSVWLIVCPPEYTPQHAPIWACNGCIELHAGYIPHFDTHHIHRKVKTKYLDQDYQASFFVIPSFLPQNYCARIGAKYAELSKVSADQRTTPTDNHTTHIEPCQ